MAQNPYDQFDQGNPYDRFDSGSAPSLTKENPNAIDEFLIQKMSQSPGLKNIPDIQGSVAGRVIQGMADIPVGAMQLGANLIGAGEPVNKRLAEIEQRTQQLRGPEPGFDWARLVGNVGSPAVGMSVSKIPMAATYMGKIKQGLGIGAVAGGTAPITTDGENFASEKVGQIAAGTALGGLLPAVAPAVTVPAKAIYRGLMERPEIIKGRAFLEAAGDKADEIINLLRGNKQIVPGSFPTAGEVAAPAGRAEFAALQKSASRVAPSEYLARADAQNAARLAAVRTVGQTPEALATAEGRRSAAAMLNYGEAYDVAVKADPRLLKISENPYFKDALPDALKLADANGIDPKTGLTQFLHYVKIAIDKQLTRTGETALASTEKASVTAIQKELVKWMGQKNPAYEKARSAFAEASKPINQMQIGQYLEKKLIPALSEEAKQKAGIYAGALEAAPATIKKATGSPRFEKLSEILKPEQLNVVNSVRDDLARLARFESMATFGGKSGPSALDLATAGMEREAGGRIPNILHRGAMVANAIIVRLEGKINKQLASEIAVEMLNPPKAAQTMIEAQKHAQSNKLMARHIQQRVQRSMLGGIQTSQRE